MTKLIRRSQCSNGGLRIGKRAAWSVLSAAMLIAVVGATVSSNSVLDRVANSASMPGRAIDVPNHFSSSTQLHKRRSALVRIGSAISLPAGSTPAPHLPARQVLTLGFVLPPRNKAALSKYVKAVQDPSSPQYHRYLTPTRFDEQFAPSQAAVLHLDGQLRALDLRPLLATSNHLLVPFSGTVTKIEAVFHTQLKTFRLTSGRIGWAPTSTPLIVRSIGNEVSGLVGLDDSVVPHALDLTGRTRALGHRQAKPATRYVVRMAIKQALSSRSVASSSPIPKACPAASRAAKAASGWTDTAIAHAYGFDGLYQQGDFAKGQTIAVYELEPFSTTGVATFERCYLGKSQTNLITRVPIDHFNLAGSGSGEAMLDIETLAALAPQAHLLVYEAPNTTFGAMDEYNAIVSQDQANIATTSWGICEASLQASAPGAQQLEGYLFEEAAAEGQTFFAATGDDGSDDCAGTPYGSSKPVKPYLSVDDPASQPFVVAVGGTSVVRVSQPPQQAAWNDGPSSGAGGGGISSTWPSPPWQANSTIPGIQTNANRELPDVSASADEFHGITVYDALGGGGATKPGALTPERHVVDRVTSKAPGVWSTIGGTSEAAPIWAAAAAEIAGSRSCVALPHNRGGTNLGFLAPVLYEVASDPTTYSASFSQVTKGNTDLFGLKTGYNALPGYNMATGLGTPELTSSDGTPALASGMCDLADAAYGASRSAGASSNQPVESPTIEQLLPASGPISGGETVTIIGSGFGGGTPGDIQVAFGGVRGIVKSVSANQIVVTTPAALVERSSAQFSGAGPADVVVTEPSARGVVSSLASPRSVYSYFDPSPRSGLAQPVVTGVGPYGGANESNRSVVLYGEAFIQGGPVVSVTFGGVSAKSWHVVSDHELMVVPPSKGNSTKCLRGKGFVPKTICQVQVVVGNHVGLSPRGTILPAVSGKLHITAAGFVARVPGREVAPGPTEYDYAPRPVVTRVTSTSAGPSHRIGPIIVYGHGFSILTLEWVNIGNPRTGVGEQTKWTEITPNELVIQPYDVPATALVGYFANRVSVQSVGGLSRLVTISAP